MKNHHGALVMRHSTPNNTARPSYTGKQAAKNLNTDQSDLLIGRRQTVGNLDWDWRLTYMDPINGEYLLSSIN
jgi:hypothetical protein